METNGAISFKVYLFQENSQENEVRRFAVPQTIACDFSQICEKLVQVFPKLSGKLFFVFWKDDDEDEVYVSSDEELIIAITSMKSEVKKFYIKIKNTLNYEDSKGLRVVHPMVFCDGCNKKIEGFRYKCILCKDYDLCSLCEQKATHSEHPMLRIPNPNMFDGVTLHRLGQIFSTFCSSKFENLIHSIHLNKKHGEGNSHSDCHKRKRKYEKYEMGHDQDDYEGGCQRKHSHGKCKRISRCTYKTLLDDFWYLLRLVDFQSQQNHNSETTKSTKECTGDTLESDHFQNIEKTITSFLNWLGVNVDIEIQPKDTEDKKNRSKDSDAKDNLSSDSNSSSSSDPKEATFTTSEDVIPLNENNKKKISESSEKDDWVSFVDLKKEVEALNSPNSGATIKPKCTVTFNIDKEEKTYGSPSKDNVQHEESQSLYPKLNYMDIPKDPKIRDALEKMLAMGFTNDGGWLTQLLEFKKGDISQVLEVLTPHNIH